MSYGSPSGCHSGWRSDSKVRLPEQPTKPRRFGEEENYATNQKERTTEAQVSPQENQDCESREVASSEEGREQRWQEPRRRYPPVQARGTADEGTVRACLRRARA